MIVRMNLLIVITDIHVSKTDISSGAIAGIVIGILAACGCCIGIIFYVKNNGNNKGSKLSQQEDDDEYEVEVVNPIQKQ